MAAPTTHEVLRACFFGYGRGTLVDRVAVVFAWCVAICVFLFNALFPILMEDGNLLIRAVFTLVLAAPLMALYAWRRRSLLARVR